MSKQFQPSQEQIDKVIEKAGGDIRKVAVANLCECLAYRKILGVD